MASWSAENATEAFLNTLKMGQKAKEPDVAEFISALAAGNNAQLMVVAYARSADHKIQALSAAAHQTGGRVVCIVPGLEELNISQTVLGLDSNGAEFVVGEAEKLLMTQFREADFVLIDCNLNNHESILGDLRSRRNQNSTVVVGFNALRRGSGSGLSSGGSKTHLLPIGKGLLVTKVAANYSKSESGSGDGNGIRSGRSRWVVKVDKCTGEEHVFRVRVPQGKVIKA